MALLTHDATSSRLASGLGFALVSSVSFGMSGAIGGGLIAAGWSAGSATLARVAIAAAVLIIPGLRALRGRWDLLRRSAPTVVAYGVFAVAGAQLCYFMAIGHLPVGIALLIEYLAPLVVVGWMWALHGRRPGILTGVGAGLALVGVALLLDITGGASISLVGILWALCAMVGASVYFILSAESSEDLPPLTLAAGGLVVALVVLTTAAVVGILPMAASTSTVHYLPVSVPWWAALLLLGTVTAALSYTTGIAAIRRLGARLASFVALTELLTAAVAAWILLGQTLGALQLAGGALVLAGVVVVKLGEQPADTVVESLAEPPALSDPPAPVPL